MGVGILQSDSGGDSGMLGGGTMIGDGSMGVMRGKGDAMIGVGARKESGVDGVVVMIHLSFPSFADYYWTASFPYPSYLP